MIKAGQVRIAVAPSTWAGVKFVVSSKESAGWKVLLEDSSIRYWSERWLELCTVEV